MRLHFQEIRQHAKEQTRTRSHSLAITVSILASYVVCGFVEQVYREKDLESRQRAIKAMMVEAAMPNATAAVYSKAAVHFLSEIVSRNGLPIRDRDSSFWSNWHSCLTANDLKNVVVKAIEETIQANTVTSISELFSYCKVKYINRLGTMKQVAEDLALGDGSLKDKSILLELALRLELSDRKWLVRELVRLR